MILLCISTKKQCEVDSEIPAWKQILVHIHLSHKWQWDSRPWTHHLTEIGAIQSIMPDIDNMRFAKMFREDPKFVYGRKVHCTMSEVCQTPSSYCLTIEHGLIPNSTQLNCAKFLNQGKPETIFASMPIKLVTTKGRVPEDDRNGSCSPNNYVAWIGAINRVLQAKHAINTNKNDELSSNDKKFLHRAWVTEKDLVKKRHSEKHDLEVFDLHDFIE